MDLISKYEGLPPSLRTELNLVDHNKNYVKHCDWCNKEFDIYQARSVSKWAYKTKDRHIFCGIECLNNFEKARDERRKKKCGN